MSGVSVPSPAILKRSTGAANVGTAGGDTVQQWVTAFDVAMGEVQSDVGALESLAGTFMPKTGGTFSGDIEFVNGCFIRGYNLSGNLQAIFGISSHSGVVAIGASGNTVDTYHVVSETNNIAMFVGVSSSEGNRRLTLSAAGVRFGSSGAICKTILDEDDFASNSATALATQQSIKSYVDTSVAAIPSPGIVLISSADITTPVAAIDLVLGGYDEYIIELMNVIPAVHGAELYVKTSSDGGASFDSGAADYSYKVYSDSNYGLDSISKISVIQGNLGVSSAHSGYCGSVRVLNPHESGATHIYGIFSYVAKTGALAGGNMSGIRHEKAAVDAIRFYFDSGNVASGKVAIYGVNR